MNCKVKYMVINNLRKIKHSYLSLKTIFMKVGKKRNADPILKGLSIPYTLKIKIITKAKSNTEWFGSNKYAR